MIPILPLEQSTQPSEGMIIPIDIEVNLVTPLEIEIEIEVIT